MARVVDDLKPVNQPVLHAFSAVKDDVKEKAEATNNYLSMKELEKMALTGDCNAQAQLGRNYLYGRQTAKNRQEAEKWLLIAAKRQETLAGKWAQGLCHEEGIGTLKNEKAALGCYQEVANQNYLPAQLSVARCLELGLGTSKQEKEALNVYTKCAASNALAQAHVARCHLDGIGVVVKDSNKVMQFAAQSAEQGDSLGQRILARCYAGEGPTKDQLLDALNWV